MHEFPPIAAAFQALIDERFAHLMERCREQSIVFYDDAGVSEHLQRVLLASDFAYESFLRYPDLLGPQLITWINDPRTAEARAAQLDLAVNDPIAQFAALRRFRRQEALRLIWRDVNGLDDVEATLSGSSMLAEVCLETALRWSEALLLARHGTPRDSAGQVQQLVVFALGKLGGGELNFSSDIDLILAYPENGATDGLHSVENETFFIRLSQQLTRLLSELTIDGYVYRVDLRLRPFGSAGRLALSFAAMEQYYQQEGRDWERYAWIKARPVAGDVHAGHRLIEILRPFIYRRYLDYTAFAGLREMKALIDAEVARKDLATHLKLGPGGIREIEFIVQLLQLIRGGREPSLRVSGLLRALTVCEQRGWLKAVRAKRLRDAYLFLRRLENRLQMLRDEQTHELPEDALDRERYAVALGYSDWSALAVQLNMVRSSVSEEFAAWMVAAQGRSEIPPMAHDYWQRLSMATTAGSAELGAMGFSDSETLLARLNALLHSTPLRNLSVRARCDRLMPHLLQAAAVTAAPDACLDRLLRLVHAVLRRSSYLALLDEQPVARQRLVALFAASGYLAERVIAHPLLLDELFEARIEADLPGRVAIASEIARRCTLLENPDVETEIEVLQEEKHSVSFRVGLAYLSGRNDAIAASRALSDLAEAIVAATLQIAERDTIQQYGILSGYAGAGTGLAVLGYGSLGGSELGFASDLDLVFVYGGALSQSTSSGPKVLDGGRYYARLAQRIVHLLTTLTRAGQLYDVDVRLRPDGGKGLLVTSLDAFIDYQRERAWTWEHQALVRARFVAGDSGLAARFKQARSTILRQPRDALKIGADICAMRSRWRVERDRSDTQHVDLKQGAGALLDIEFLLQALVLLHAEQHFEVLDTSDSGALILALAEAKLLSSEQAQTLTEAHRTLLAVALSCTLDARSRLVSRTAEIDTHCRNVLRIAEECGLLFAKETIGD